MAWLGRQSRSRANKYWDGLLGDYNEVAEIPSIANRNGVFESRVESVEVGRELTMAIERVAAEHHVTVNTVLETAWGMLLQKYNRSDDVAFGKVVSGRSANLAGIEQTVGLFINTIPVRVEATAEKKVWKLIEEMQAQAVESLKYEHSPLMEIQSRSRAGRNLTRTLFVFENYYFDESVEGNQMDGLTITMENSREEAEYDMTIVTFLQGGLHLEAMYNASRYEADEVRLVLRRMETVLEQIASNADVTVGDLELATEDEKSKILFNFNDTDAEYPKEETIVSLFEEQAARVPENTAVVFENEKLTYAELNGRANRLAWKLRELGVRPDDRVALVAERSVEMIVGILGTLKAGGAYVPVDPDYPEDRIRYTLEDCGAKVVLTYGTDAPHGISAPALDMGAESSYSGNEANLKHVNKPDDLAYIIYTSGTTGRPKGTLIEHKNVVSLLLNDRFKFDISETDTWTLFHSYCFDFSVWEMYGALLTGARLIVVSREMALDPKEFLTMVEESGVTILSQVPSSFNYLMDVDSGNSMRSLRYLVLGGEALLIDRIKFWIKNYPNLTIVNIYGPTETTVYATNWFYGIGQDAPDRVPIGKPSENKKVYILDGERLCGIGVPGELCIAGVGLARGYLNQPELTAEKFVRNPFGEGRLYRSGDLARWLPDGNIEYLGRIDEQVKIRGFRVELGEIASVIRAQENVRDAAVVAKEVNGDKSICAYIVFDGEADIHGVEDSLKELLPDYMMPAYMMEIESLPLTRNGKLDKRALPEPEAVSSHAYVAPETEAEKAVVTVFEEILGTERIGVDDDFFQMGGDSIKAIRAVSKLRERGYEVTVKDLMQWKITRALVQQLKVSQNNIKDTHENQNRTEIVRHKNEIDLLISDGLRSYPVNFANSSVSASYPPLFMQGLFLADDIRIPTVIKVRQSYDKVSEILNALIDSQDVFRTRYNASTKCFEQLTSTRVKFPKIQAESQAECKLINSEFVNIASNLDLLTQSAMLVNILIAQVSDSEVYVLVLAHHGIWDGASTELLKAFLTDGRNYSASASLARHSYTDYCMRYCSLSKNYQFSVREEGLFKELFSHASIDNISAGETKLKVGTNTLLNIPLDRERYDLFAAHPIETAILTVYNLLNYGNEKGNEMMFHVLYHNRNDNNRNLMGLTVDFLLYAYNSKENTVYCHVAEPGIPLSEKMNIWLQRHQHDLPPIFTVVINYLDMFNIDENIRVDQHEDYTVKVLDTEEATNASNGLSLTNIAITLNFNRGKFVASLLNISATQDEITQTLDSVEKCLQSIEIMET